MPVALKTSGLRVKGSDGSVATTTIAAPAGLARGDFLVLIGGSDTDTAQSAFVGPAEVDGFTALTPWGGGLGGANLKLWTRFATGADVGKTYTITVPTGSAQVLYLAAFSGVDPVNPVAVAPVQTDGGSTAALAAPAGSLTSPIAGAFALFAWFAKGGAVAQAFTVPAGTTSLDSSTSNANGAGYVKAALGAETIGTDATGTRTATLTGTARRWSAVSLALRPAATITPPVGADALQRRELAALREWQGWLGRAGAKGHVGEFGVVTLYGAATGVPQWTALLEAYLTELDAAGVAGHAWASGREWGNGYPIGIHVGPAVGDPLSIANATSSNYAAHPPRGAELHGVNLSGWEKGASVNGGDVTVRSLAAGYVHTSADFAYLAAQGVKSVRLPCAWERLQPTRGAALDTTALSTLDGMLTAARANGISVALDPLHNYGRYTLASGAVDALGGNITNAQLVDFWQRLSTWVRASTARDLTVVAYDLMNEPHDLVGGAATWQSASQAVVTALRNAGDTRELLVEGYSFASLVSWSSSHPQAWITDPTGNFRYSAHHYFDTQSALGSRSGTYQQAKTGGGVEVLTYATELASASAGESLGTLGPVDDFSGGLGKWTGTYGGPTVVNGRLRVPSGVAPPNYAGAETASTGQALAGRAWYFEVPTPAPATGVTTGDAYTQAWVYSKSAAAGTRVGFAYLAKAGVLAFDLQADYYDASRVTIPFDATAHRWWRLEHTGTALRWLTSPNGAAGSWTVQRTLSGPPAWTQTADQALALESFRDSGTAAYAEFDNVNVSPSSSIPPRTYVIGQAVERNGVQSITRLRSRAVGQALEADQVRPVNRKPGEVRTAVEADQVPPVTRIRTTRIGEPTEVDSASAVARRRLRRLGQAGERNIVQPIKRLRLTRIGQAIEYDVLRQLEESASTVTEEAYQRAIDARQRRAFGTLRVDWTGRRSFPTAVTDPGYLDDVADEIEVERALDGDLPEGAGQVDGFATATLTAGLGGTRKGATMPFAAELSPFRPDSPLYGVKYKTLSEVAAEIGFVTDEGPRAERLFTGPVRDLDPDEGSSTVRLEAADPSERLRALVTLPTYGEFVTHAKRRPWALTVNTQAVVDAMLRRNGIFASPPPRAESIIVCTGHGGLFAERGFNGAPISIYGSGPGAGLWTEGDHPYGLLGTPESPSFGTVGYQEFYGITDGVSTPLKFQAGYGVGFSCLLHAGSYMNGPSSTENRLLQIRPVETEYPRLFVNVFGNGDLYAGLSTSASTIIATPRIATGPGPWRFLGVHFQWTSNTTLVVRVRLDGALRTYTLTVPAVSISEVPSPTFGGYRPILQANAGLSRSWTNLQVWPRYTPPTTSPSEPWQGESHVPQADLGRGNNELVYLPDVSSAESWAVLKAATAAEFAVHGFTEYGRYYWRPRTDVRPDRIDHVLDVKDNLAEVGYKLSSDNLRNSVGITTSRSYHSGELQAVVKADDVEQFVCPVGTTTFELDWPHGAAGYQGGILQYHYQEKADTAARDAANGYPMWSGDVVHGWTYSTRGASGNWTILDNTRSVVVRYVQTDARRVQLRVSNPGPGPVRLATAMPADASSEGEPAMRIGGWPLEKAVDRVTSYRNEASILELGGQAGGGERALPIEASEWRQDDEALAPVAWALLDALAEERPLLEDLPVRGNPRIRVGNVAECHFRDLSVPVTGTVVKTRHRLSGEGGKLESFVSVRPLPTTQLAPDGWSFFVDVSHYQAETATPLDLARLKVLGYAGVIAKIGQGAGTTSSGTTYGATLDAAWEKWRDEGRALWPRTTAGYWYLGNTEAPADQAARCLAAIGDTSIPVMLDWEAGGGDFANLLAVLDAFRAAGLLVTMVYAGRGYAGTAAPSGSSLAGRGVSLISARYWTNDPAGTDPTTDFADQLRARPTSPRFGFEPFLGLTPRANQFTQYGRVYPGQLIDVDAFPGTPTQLAAMFHGE